MDIFQRNLTALAVSSPRLAQRLRETPPLTDLIFAPSDEGSMSASHNGRALCSRRRPNEEASRLASTIDVSANAAVVVCGFGAGYHVRAILEKLAKTGVLFVYEPDLALLRAILQKIDHSGWLVSRSVTFLTDEADTAAIAESVRGHEGLLALGVAFLEHPADRARLGDRSVKFQSAFTSVYRAVRTTVVTTLMQSDVTLRNLLMNVDRYATCPGIADLKGCAQGRPAIIVSAGPSLRRNIELLAHPRIRERFVIIAVQTVLKQLLARGIRPHFVTALDYHEISRRFYEGLTAADVEGTTLVAEPKANPTILDAFPGAIRIPADHLPGSNCPSLDDLLGDQLRRDMGVIPAGATVAHLACYLARHMGCDPLILVGQDLGFTDGQYYSAGAAIHETWGPELNPFNTLEMMEWQRIVRSRSFLHRATDTLGRPIYTDEQMATYRVQFERDFAADAQRGLRTIDATEGGVAKRGAEAMPLARAIALFAPDSPLSLPEAAPPRDALLRPARLAERLRAVRQDIWRVEEASRRAGTLLEEMLACHADQPRVNKLIERVHALGAEAMSLATAFGLVQRLNQTGTLKRAKADRQIEVDANLPPMERQRREIRRDITNLAWTAESAAKLGQLLEASLASLTQGVPKLTRDEPAAEESAPGAPAREPRLAALIPFDPVRSALGTPRDLARPIVRGLNAAQLTLARLASSSIHRAIILTPDPDRARAIVGRAPDGLDITFVRTDGPPLGARAGAVASARLWARTSWRGGIAGLTVYDEVCAPAPMLAAMREHNLDAAVLLGPDWSFIDPALIDECAARYRARPFGDGAHRLCFCQCPPGLGPAIVERSLMQELADRASQAGVFASIGGLLGYVPVAPLADPIAKPVCVVAPATVRNVQHRFIADAAPHSGRDDTVRLAEALGDELATGGGGCERLAAAMAHVVAPPSELVLELCTGRLTTGRAGRRTGEAPERPVLTLSLADRIFRQMAELRPDAVVTLAGAGDPLLHPEWPRIVSLARRAGLAGVHIRTDLVAEPERCEALLTAGVDVISVDMAAETPEVYRAVMGADLLDRARANLVRLLERRAPGELPSPWIVPRITRCDASYADIESFYDRWIMLAGAAAIDPLPAAIPGERIEPLPPPPTVQRRIARERLVVLSDGAVVAADADAFGERPVGDALKGGLAAAWRRIVQRSESPVVEPKGLGGGALLHGGGTRARVARLERA